MALAHVQDSETVVLSTLGATYQTATLTFADAISEGSMIVVYVALHNVATRTFTVTDDVDGAYGDPVIYTNPYYGVGLWRKANHTAGDTTITVVHNGASSAFYAGASEFSDFGATPVTDATDSLAEAANTDNHTCSASGVTSSNECIAVCAGVLNSLATSTAHDGAYRPLDERGDG